MKKTVKIQTGPQASRLLWVKLPTNYADTLRDTAESIGISRADFMRLILINFISNEQNTFTVNTTDSKVVVSLPPKQN